MIKNPPTNESADNTIPVDIAKKMTAAFRASEKSDSTKYTKAAWFPASQITSLAEKVAKFGGDGVRIYFGRYTQDIIDCINKLGYGDEIPSSYAEMNTLLFVVTKDIDGKPRTDYFIDKLSDDSHFAITKKVGDAPSSTDPDNRAKLCPDECDDGSELMN
ncbi:hypothetical protein D7004_18945 [Pedobacter jejuensis]|uniref:Uncharacterized protein n=2 Tax=Pedobacter jejuensis TaxID=1268550 RepID=A0A3N0BND9_9SPHI|nr:hypothetical protein D7004_18945 [Pedobacter jejuensis]